MIIFQLKKVNKVECKYILIVRIFHAVILCTTVIYLLNIASKSSTNYKKREMKYPGTTSVKGDSERSAQKIAVLNIRNRLCVWKLLALQSHSSTEKQQTYRQSYSSVLQMHSPMQGFTNFLRKIFFSSLRSTSSWKEWKFMNWNGGNFIVESMLMFHWLM